MSEQLILGFGREMGTPHEDVERCLATAASSDGPTVASSVVSYGRPSQLLRLFGVSVGQTVGRDEEDARWVTKVELAKLRGISLASTDRLVRRQKWRRQRGNDKRARILVPLSWLSSDKSPGDEEAANDVAPDSTEDATEDGASDGSEDKFHIISVFERQIDHEREEKKQLFEALQAAGERERELTDRIVDLQAERDSLLENLSMWRLWRWRRRRRKEREKAAQQES